MKRRLVLRLIGGLLSASIARLLGWASTVLGEEPGTTIKPPVPRPVYPTSAIIGDEVMPHSTTTCFLCGDVMTGRGIDQIMPQPSQPDIYEGYMRSAKGYVELAEQANGAIEQPVDYPYIWGEALNVLQQEAPQVRLVNLETAVTTSDEYWRGKGINYRMHPDNIRCLTAAAIQCCSLANNHVLDWGYSGLGDTLATLKQAGIHSVGAGETLSAAQSAAAIHTAPGNRLIVFGCGSPSSGIPPDWAARVDKPGINMLDEFSAQGLAAFATQVRAIKRPGDVVVCSIHWGGNWGYDIPASRRRFAHRLIDRAAVDIVHGHSSHHPLGIEVYRDKLILYGCGDFINDYEGIGGHEDFRGELSLMYFVAVDPRSGNLARLKLVPLQINQLQLHSATAQDASWLHDTLNREGQHLGTRVQLNEDNTMLLHWGSAA
jgi:poly-gamma-glutamate synthesis protein (capsule biosynthesis protein)